MVFFLESSIVMSPSDKNTFPVILAGPVSYRRRFFRDIDFYTPPELNYPRLEAEGFTRCRLEIDYRQQSARPPARRYTRGSSRL
jgi:hypothetical protein